MHIELINSRSGVPYTGLELEANHRTRIDRLVEKLKAESSIEIWQELSDELYLYRALYGNSYTPKIKEP